MIGDPTSFDSWMVGHVHRWVRYGMGTGTSESTTVWGTWRCWCGVFTTDDDPSFVGGAT